MNPATPKDTLVISTLNAEQNGDTEQLATVDVDVAAAEVVDVEEEVEALEVGATTTASSSPPGGRVHTGTPANMNTTSRAQRHSSLPTPTNKVGLRRIHLRQ